MYIHTFVTVYIYMVIVAVYTIILLISQFHTFFLSLFFVCKMNLVSDFSSPHLLFPQIHTNIPTQTHSHRQINTEIYKHMYTHMDKPIEREWEGSMLVLVAYGLVDWCWWWRSEFVARWKWVWVLVDRCLWVNRNEFWCLWIGVGGGDRCLWCLWWRGDLALREKEDACGGEVIWLWLWKEEEESDRER